MLMIATTANAQEFSFDEMTYTPKKTVFKLFAPNDAKCYVTVGQRQIPMKRKGDCLWQATVKGNLLGQPYVFNAGHGDTPGVFAKAVGVNGQQAYVIDLSTTNPEGWQNDQRPLCTSPADLVIYELHHRDFSIARPDAKYPGKFLALTEPWAIEHLKSLGVNAVHILPSYDFGSVDETRLHSPQYNWGYDPVNYNVPEGSYSTDPYDPTVRIREFKQMVQALHKAGIRVILDVVYNHTYDIEHSNFQKTYPDYFYRKNADGSWSNGSGCGNETASERPMMRRFMIESVKYWIIEYHIDGFRFDLMGCHDIETMNQIRQAVDAIDPTIFIYGEGWSAGQCALPSSQLGAKANIPQMPRIAAFSDEMRDALRGPFSDDTKPGILGMSKNAHTKKATAAQQSELATQLESLKFGIVGCIPHPQVDMSLVNYSKESWAMQPTQMIAYVSCHDDMCLVDRLKASIPDLQSTADVQQLTALVKLAQTAVFTSQGVPFMLSGEELLRDKKGVHNSYNSPDSVNHLDWQNLQRYPEVFDYYKNLIQLRKQYPHFRLGTAELVRQHLTFLEAPKGVVAYRITAPSQNNTLKEETAEAAPNMYVMLNFTSKQQTISIPRGTYRVLCTRGTIQPQGLYDVKCSTATVAPHSALIIHD